MKTIVYLVRHGQTDWNVSGRVQGQKKVPLNDLGKKQAALVAALFKRIRLDRVYSSPVFRAVQTAKTIAKNVVIAPEFREREIGGLAGLVKEEILAKFPTIRSDQDRDGIDWHPPGTGETLREFQQRCIKNFQDLVQENQGKKVLVITHGGVIKGIVHWLHGGRPEDFLHIQNPENAEVVRIESDGKQYGLPLKVTVMKEGI